MKTEEDKMRDAAKNYVEGNTDSEVRRMYGHHYRSFCAGWEQSTKADKERIQELERALEASQNVLLSIHSGYSLKMTNAETTEVRTVMALNFKTLNPL